MADRTEDEDNRPGRTMTARPGGRRSTVLAFALVLLLAAGLSSCSSGGDTSAASGSTDAPASADTDLASKLPGAAAVGDGYRLRANSFTEPPEPFDPATTTTTTATRFNTLDRSCPGARWPTLDAHPDVEGVEYVRFAKDDDREITVGLAPLPDSMDRNTMTQLLEAINECGTVTDEAGPAVLTTTVHAEPLTDVGDYGIDIRQTFATTFASDPAGNPMGPSSQRTYLFVEDDTLVSVVADGGFALDQLHTLAPDEDLVPTVAAATAKRIAG